MVDGAGKAVIVGHDGPQIHLGAVGGKTGGDRAGVFIGAVEADIGSNSNIVEVRVYVLLVLKDHLRYVAVAIPGVGPDDVYVVFRMERITDVGEGNSHAGPLLAVRPLLMNVRLKSHGTRLRAFPGDLYECLLVVFRGVVVRGIVYPEDVTLHHEGYVAPVYDFRSGLY